MNIVHIFKTYMPETNGGIEQVIEDLCEFSPQDGVVATVITTANVSKKSIYTWKNHKVIAYPRFANIFSTPISFSLVKNFKTITKKADIINYHFPWPLMDICQALLGKKKPYIITYHSDVVRQKSLKKIYTPLMQKFLRGAEAIVVTSKEYAETSKDLKPYSSKIRVIELGINGLDPKPNKAKIETARRISELKPGYVLFIGVLRYYKGLDKLLCAADKINSEIVIAGTGPEEQKLEGIVQSKKLTNVHFVGKITELEKYELLKNAAVFAFPSNERSEAFGISLLEASSMGLPLVTFEIGTGTSHVNKNNQTGFVVPKDDIVEFVAKINILLEDIKLRVAMGAAARTRYEKYFTASRMKALYKELYSTIAKEEAK